MIIFEKLGPFLKSKGKTYYSLRKDNIVGSETIEKLKGNKKGKAIDTRTIDAICDYLDCQPADIMEFRREEADAGSAADPGSEPDSGTNSR